MMKVCRLTTSVYHEYTDFPPSQGTREKSFDEEEKSNRLNNNMAPSVAVWIIRQ